MSLKPVHDGKARSLSYESAAYQYRPICRRVGLLIVMLLSMMVFNAQADPPPPQATATPAAPYLRVYPWSKGTQCTLFWTSVPNVTGYLIQRDDASDFKTPLQTVTISSTATLGYAFQLSNFSDGKISWYRVRGIRRDGQIAWSNVTLSTQDLQTPTVALEINGGAATASASLVALSVGGVDPGTNPSGLHLMRFKLNNSNWTEWEPFAATHNLRLDPVKLAHTVYAEVIDRAGNVSLPVGAKINLALRPVYVAGNYSGAASDGSLAHPYQSIQAAINAADAPADIFIAEGRYSEEINLKSGIALFGGFPRGNFSYAARNPETYPTSLLGGTTNMTLNKIVRMSNVTDVWLDGLTCGPHNVVAHDLVGFNDHIGIFCENIGDSCRISNCTIRELGYGVSPLTRLAGIDMENASPVIDQCTVRDNRAHTGAAILCRNGSMPLIDRCLVANNQFNLGVMHTGPFTTSVGGYGAGISLYLAAPTIQNTIIHGTSGVYDLSYTQYGAAGIIDQSAYEMAGNSIPAIQNCTIYNNHIGLFTIKEGSIRNCIVWNNGLLNTVTPTYSSIASWTGGGQGNINADPKFIDPSGGDFRLLASSPCIDAGGTVPGLATDFDGNPRGIQGTTAPRGDGSRIDMGAYEYQPSAKLIARPNFSVPGGSYLSPLRVKLGCPTAYVTIHYTLDGREPGEDSPVYTAPLMLTGKPGATFTVKARAFRAGWVPSMAATATYTVTPIVISQISRTGMTTGLVEPSDASIYLDANVQFVEPIPDIFRGALFLKTWNNDRYGIRQFSFTVNQPVMVYVAMSDGFGGARPAWLASWTKCAEKLTTTDTVPGRTLYRKAFPAGQVNLGVNRDGTMPTGPGMYTVIVLAQ